MSVIEEGLSVPLKTLASRRDRVRARLAGGVMILPAAPILKRSRDTEVRYRPDSELFYLTGAVHPGVVAVLRDADEEAFVLFVPEKDAKKEVWFGPRPGPGEAKELYGAEEVYPIGELEERLPDLVRPHREVFFRLGGTSELDRLLLNELTWARNRGQRKGEGLRGIVDPGEILDDLRLVKDPEEIERVRKATAVTVAGFQDAICGFRPGMGEWEVEALLESSFRKRGASGPAFPTIVGSGKNGCVLHYLDNRDPIGESALVLVDAGAEVGLYSGDVTRTFPASGRFDSRQMDIYGLVLEAHSTALSLIRPGTPVAEIHEAVRGALAGGLLDLGVLEGSVEEVLERDALESFYPHQTSHWLGMDVHDVGDYASRGESRVLEPGMVLTVEPGLYFSDRSDGPADPAVGDHPFQGMGIRIEDDVLVTEDGFENLTGALAVRPAEVESLVGG
jgi:Xaa-Pro aminopeptidase